MDAAQARRAISLIEDQAAVVVAARLPRAIPPDEAG